MAIATAENPMPVLTPVAACEMFGRSGAAVWAACNNNNVTTIFSLLFTHKQIRLIELQSAVRFWGTEHLAQRGTTLAAEVARLTEVGGGITIKMGVRHFLILHPYRLYARATEVKGHQDL